MTEKALPSTNRSIEAFKTAGAIAYGGHSAEGFVIDGASPTELSIQDANISQSSLNTFAETSSASSFDVTIDPGEGFVFGSWVVKDTATTVTLASSTSGQTVYVGWNKDGSDDVIIGLSSAFDNATGNTDEKIELWDFDTDGSGVTSVTDRRSIGYTQQATSFEGNISLDEGLAIEDGSGTQRLEFRSGNTSLQDQNGDSGLLLNGGSSYQIRPTSTTPFTIADQEGGFTGVQYTTSASAPGTLELTNAKLDASPGGGDIRIATGQAIEDGSGTDRLRCRSDLTAIYDDTGRSGFIADNGLYNQIRTYADQRFDIRDMEGGFSAVTYVTSASVPGTFRLNANLDASTSNKMTLPLVSADPTASAGDMWYRTDLD